MNIMKYFISEILHNLSVLFKPFHLHLQHDLRTECVIFGRELWPKAPRKF